MTVPSVFTSFLLVALEESTLRIKATYAQGNRIALNRCPFTLAHQDVPNRGAVVITDRDGLNEDYLWCRLCGRKTRQQVIALLSGVTLFRAHMRWDDVCRYATPDREEHDPGA